MESPTRGYAQEIIDLFHPPPSDPVRCQELVDGVISDPQQGPASLIHSSRGHGQSILVPTQRLELLKFFRWNLANWECSVSPIFSTVSNDLFPPGNLRLRWSFYGCYRSGGHSSKSLRNSTRRSPGSNSDPWVHARCTYIGLMSPSSPYLHLLPPSGHCVCRTHPDRCFRYLHILVGC